MADDAARDAARGAGGAAAPAGAGVNGRRSRGSVASADSVVLLVAMLLLALPQLEAAWAPLPIEEPLHVQPGYGSAMGADVGAQALVPFSATSSGALYLLASEGGATSLHSLVWFPPTGSALFEYSNYQAAVTGGLQNKEDWVSLVVNAATAGATNNICINSKRLAGTAVCGPGYSPNQYDPGTSGTDPNAPICLGFSGYYGCSTYYKGALQGYFFRKFGASVPSAATYTQSPQFIAPPMEAQERCISRNVDPVPRTWCEDYPGRCESIKTSSEPRPRQRTLTVNFDTR